MLCGGRERFPRVCVGSIELPKMSDGAQRCPDFQKFASGSPIVLSFRIFETVYRVAAPVFSTAFAKFVLIYQVGGAL